MKLKLKLYKEIIIFMKQNGKMINSIRVIQFKDRCYELSKHGLVIINISDDFVTTIYKHFIIKGMRSKKPFRVTVGYLEGILQDLKININEFLQKK